MKKQLFFAFGGIVLCILALTGCTPKAKTYNFNVSVNGGKPVAISSMSGSVLAIETDKGDYAVMIGEEGDQVTYQLSKPGFAYDESKGLISVTNTQLGNGKSSKKGKVAFSDEGQQIAIELDGVDAIALDNAPGTGTGCTADGNPVCCWVATGPDGKKIRCCGTCSDTQSDCDWCKLKFPDGWLTNAGIVTAGEAPATFNDLVKGLKIEIKATKLPADTMTVN